MIEEKHKIAGLVHIAHNGELRANLVSDWPEQLWDVLDEAGLTRRLYGHPVTTRVLTPAGHDYLHRSLST